MGGGEGDAHRGRRHQHDGAGDVCGFRQVLGDSDEGDVCFADDRFGNGRGEHRAKAPGEALFGGEVELAEDMTRVVGGGFSGDDGRVGFAVPDGAGGVWLGCEVVGGEGCADCFGALREDVAVGEDDDGGGGWLRQQVQAQLRPDPRGVAGGDDDGEWRLPVAGNLAGAGMFFHSGDCSRRAGRRYNRAFPVAFSAFPAAMNSASVVCARSGLSFRAGGRGAATVFLHGVGLNKNAWRSQESFFSAVRTVVVCDLPGHGDSPAPENPDPDLSDYSAPVAALLDGLRLAVVDVVGHSFGGLVALDFALRFPARVRRLVVLSGVFCRDRAARKAALSRVVVLENGKSSERAAMMEDALRRWFGKSGGAIVDEVRGWLSAADPAGYARAYRLFAASDAVFADRLGDLQSPALFVAGDDDPHSTPAMAREMASRARRGAFEILPGQRHMAALVAPEVVNPLLRDFLDGDVCGGARPPLR